MLEHRLGELTHSGGERTRPRRRLPQHATKPVERPRTIASILETSDGMTPEQTMTRIVAAVPETTPEDLFRALNEYGFNKARCDPMRTSNQEQRTSARHYGCLPSVARSTPQCSSNNSLGRTNRRSTRCST